MQAASARAPVISITIPCYQQLPHARRVVEIVLAQPINDFELTLVDDGASDEYRDYVLSLADPRVRYHRNPTRLGAMRGCLAGSAAATRVWAEIRAVTPRTSTLGRNMIVLLVWMDGKCPMLRRT